VRRQFPKYAADGSHFFGRTEGCCDDQIAFAFAVVVVGHDDDLASGKSLQYFRN